MLLIECPWCGGLVEVEKLNCGIFRHGIDKSSGQQLDPHAKMETIDLLRDKGNLIGCGKPFKLYENNNVEKCDYI